MSIDDIEAEVLKLDPQARARLAKRLLESLESLSDEENERLWAEEADRRDADWDSTPGTARPAADVLRDARPNATDMGGSRLLVAANRDVPEPGQDSVDKGAGLGAS